MLLPALALVAAAAAPQSPRIAVTPPSSASDAASGVDVVLLNPGDAPVAAEPPPRYRVTAADGTVLTLVPADAAGSQTIAPRGFITLRYLPATSVATAADVAATPADREVTVATAVGERSGFFDRFAPHQPIYGVFGTGDAGAKLQLSLAFRPIADGPLAGFTAAWTQTLFWAIDRPSGPFRSTNYSPELFYAFAVDDRTTASIGYAHDSNGRGEIGSIDVNRLFVRAARSFTLGDGWRAELVPQVWLHVGRNGAAPDIERYWGNAGLTAAVLRDDGVKLQLSLRGNPVTGRGSAELFASYPLAALGGIGLYAFGQGFTGYGEALDDYDRRSTVARIGIAFTR